MPDRKSYKIDVTKQAHKAAKIHCADKGINIKDFVSSLILQSVDNRTTKFINDIQDISIEIDTEIKHLPDRNLRSDLLNSDQHLSINSQEIPAKVLKETNVAHNNSNVDLDNSYELNDNAQNKASLITCRIYDYMSSDPIKAQTPEEIAKSLPGINRPTAQRALYWLLRRGDVQRRLRENPSDKRKNSWEYWKLKSPMTLMRKGVDTESILELIPENSEQALSVRELASKLNVPLSTTRDALSRLEFEGKVSSLYKHNYKNQTIIWYYRSCPERSIHEIENSSRITLSPMR